MIKPVDTHYSILQSPKTEKVQSVQQQQSDTQQRYLNAQLAEERRLQGEKIRSMEEEKLELVRNALEREEKKGSMKEQNKKKSQERRVSEGSEGSEEDEWNDEPMSGSYIDLKV
jgi:hypothetical protein